MAEAYSGQVREVVEGEKWLKERCENVDARFGWKVNRVEVKEGKVRASTRELKRGESRKFIPEYVVGRDGASSAVKRSLEMPLDGGLL